MQRLFSLCLLNLIEEVGDDSLGQSGLVFEGLDSITPLVGLFKCIEVP